MDIYAMRERRGLTVWLGVGLICVLVAAVVLVVLSFSGTFSQAVAMQARLPEGSAVAPVNSPVHFRDVKVGTVTSLPHPDGHGNIVVDIAIDPGQVPNIPGSVAARVSPVSIFGNEYVNLVTTNAPGPAHLSTGSVIPAVQHGASPSLQNTFTALDTVLKAVDPAKLNAGLSGLAQALTGQGKALGKTLVSANTYLEQMLDLWPQVVNDLKAFAPFATTLATSTPAFIDLLRNAVVTSETFSRHGSDFADLVGNGGRAANQTAGIITDTMQTYHDAVVGFESLLTALSQSPDIILRLFKGIANFAGNWVKAMSGGTVKVAAAPLRVTDPAALALAMVSGKNIPEGLEQAIEGNFVNPAPYTAKDCPHYGKVRAHCGGGHR